MYTVWYSTEDFARYLVEHTILKEQNKAGNLVMKELSESDANKPSTFHRMPNHIKKILYLDAPDIILDFNTKPILSLEISSEAGTGHNSFQRFSRLAAALENDVPAFYIYPEAAQVYRATNPTGTWDRINPLIFKALERAMRIYGIPALLYYFPSHYRNGGEFQRTTKGLIYDDEYPSCPDSSNQEMKSMFEAIDETIRSLSQNDHQNLMGAEVIQTRRDYMEAEKQSKDTGSVSSPITATITLPTASLINYLKKYGGEEHYFGDMLLSRAETVIYVADAEFRGDPYPGALAALDYLMCRRGKTYEERNRNLVMAWGKLTLDPDRNISLVGDQKRSINNFVESIKSTYGTGKILLGKSFDELEPEDIPRYFMQARFGSTFTKVKHIRVYSYFCDAILFPDGALWREG